MLIGETILNERLRLLVFSFISFSLIISYSVRTYPFLERLNSASLSSSSNPARVWFRRNFFASDPTLLAVYARMLVSPGFSLYFSPGISVLTLETLILPSVLIFISYFFLFTFYMISLINIQ